MRKCFDHSVLYSYFFLVGRICLLMQAHFLWPLLQRKAFLLRLNKGSNFLQSAFWIWITKQFSLVRECNVFLQCCIMLGPVRQFSLQNVKLSRIVTYRSNIIRVNCSLNWSYINLLWRIELWLTKLQLSVFLKIVWVFWLERIVPPLVSSSLATCWHENRREMQNLSGVLFGNERLVRIFSTQQHIVDRQSARNTDLVIFLLTHSLLEMLPKNAFWS